MHTFKQAIQLKEKFKWMGALMLISASRRTGIPAFYSGWLFNGSTNPVESPKPKFAYVEVM